MYVVHLIGEDFLICFVLFFFFIVACLTGEILVHGCDDDLKGFDKKSPSTIFRIEQMSLKNCKLYHLAFIK